MDKSESWLDWAVELQALAQAGLQYGRDSYDLERYQRIRDIAAEMLQAKVELPLEKVKELFCGETGYQTPKLDCRAAIFQEEGILLVKERSGKWSLPGGWVDVGLTVAENTVKEAREEAGLEVVPELVIAVQDREKHNYPVHVFKICKVFMLCRPVGGCFQENLETVDSRYFSVDELPELDTDKTTSEQVRMCFEAYHAQHWKTVFD